jgi:hypothetical protein
MFRLVVPFTNVVANVVNDQLDHTPVGVYRAIKDKKMPSDRRATTLAKGAIGTALMGSLLMLAEEKDEDGLPFISGAGPRDASKRSQMYMRGWKPYSVRVGGVYHSYQYTPYGVALGIVGQYRDAIEFKNLSDGSATDRLYFAMMNSYQTIMSMSFLSGLADFFKEATTETSSKTASQKAKKLVVNKAGSAIPNFFKQLDRVFDPTVYDSNDIKSLIAKQIPVARQSLDKALNVWGEPVERQGNKFFTIPKPDHIDKFMMKSNVWIPAIGKSTQINGVVVTPEQRRKIIEYRGPKLKKYIRQNMKNWKRKDSKEIQGLITKKSNQLVHSAKKKISSKSRF